MNKRTSSANSLSTDGIYLSNFLLQKVADPGHSMSISVQVRTAPAYAFCLPGRACSPGDRRVKGQSRVKVQLKISVRTHHFYNRSISGLLYFRHVPAKWFNVADRGSGQPTSHARVMDGRTPEIVTALDRKPSGTLLLQQSMVRPIRLDGLRKSHCMPLLKLGLAVLLQLSYYMPTYTLHRGRKPCAFAKKGSHHQCGV